MLKLGMAVNEGLGLGVTETVMRMHLDSHIWLKENYPSLHEKLQMAIGCSAEQAHFYISSFAKAQAIASVERGALAKANEQQGEQT